MICECGERYGWDTFCHISSAAHKARMAHRKYEPQGWVPLHDGAYARNVERAKLPHAVDWYKADNAYHLGVWVPAWIKRVISAYDARGLTTGDLDLVWRALAAWGSECHAAIDTAIRLGADPYDVIRAYFDARTGE